MNLPDVVSPSEPLARFITQKKWWREDRTIRYNAFMPNRSGRQTSVYRIQELNDSEIFEIGENFVAEAFGKPLLGRADVLASAVQEEGLTVEPDTEPHPRHANIDDWPEDSSKHKEIALSISAKAQLRLVDES